MIGSSFLRARSCGACLSGPSWPDKEQDGSRGRRFSRGSEERPRVGDGVRILNPDEHCCVPVVKCPWGCSAFLTDVKETVPLSYSSICRRWVQVEKLFFEKSMEVFEVHSRRLSASTRLQSL